MTNSKLFIVTGPESSGKTALATQLCDSLQAPLVPEVAREYLHKIQTNYQQQDLLNIAKEQHQQETILTSHCDDTIICDTDLLVIIIWSEVKYGNVDPWITKTFEDSLNTIPPRHYFLCDHNIPWQADSLRENPLDRDRLFNLYLQKCRHYQLTHHVIKGSPAQRLKMALAHCHEQKL